MGRNRGTFKSKVLAGLLSVGLLVAAAPLVFSGPAAAKTLTPLEKGLKFYKGKTITFIASTSAGSGNDINFRAQCAAAASYLHATCNVEDLSGGEGIQGQDTLAAAAPNGLTIGYLSNGTDLYDMMANLPSLNFNPSRVAFISGTTATNFMLIVPPNSPFKTFADLVNATASNPPSFLTLNGNYATVRQALLVTAFDLHIKIVTGYSNSTAQLGGFLRGDGGSLAADYDGVTTNTPLVRAGKAIGLTVDAHLHSGIDGAAIVSSEPTLKQLAKEFPPKTKVEKDALALDEALAVAAGYPVIAPSKTPTGEVDALRAAFAHALKSPSLISTYDTEGEEVGAVSGPAAKQLWLDCVADVNKYAKVLDLAKLVLS